MPCPAPLWRLLGPDWAGLRDDHHRARCCCEPVHSWLRRELVVRTRQLATELARPQLLGKLKLRADMPSAVDAVDQCARDIGFMIGELSPHSPTPHALA